MPLRLINLLLRFMAFWIKWFLFRYLSRPIIRSIDWTPEDRRDFELFFRSRCGSRTFELLRQVVASKTFNAVCQNDVRANAEARGAQEVLALLHRLRTTPPGVSEGYAGLEEEPQMPPETAALDGRRFGWSGGGSAI